jgi:hypothetical protein
MHAWRSEHIAETIPAKLRSFTGGAFMAEAPHRKNLRDALLAWGAGKCGKSTRAMVYAWGSPGSGKSVALCRFAVFAFRRGIVPSLFYITEEDLRWAATNQFDDGDRIGARETLRKATNAGCVILDELGAGDARGYTPAQMREVVRIVKHRIDNNRPTLIATNREPVADRDGNMEHMGWLDIRIASRLNEDAIVVHCGGADMRRSA